MLGRAAVLGRVAALGMVTPLGFAGCLCSTETRGEAEPCEAACAAVVGAGCSAERLAPRHLPECVAACREHAALRWRAGCETEWRSYARCVPGSGLECGRVRGDAWGTLEAAQAWRSCDGPAAALRRCLGRCEGAGRLFTQSRPAASGEPPRSLMVERLGCAPCPSRAAPGAPPGAPCRDASVCRPACCECADAAVRFFARVCEGGSCADAERACALTRGQPDACG